MSGPQSPLDHENTIKYLRLWTKQGKSPLQIATELTTEWSIPTSERSVRRALRRHGIIDDGPKVNPKRPSGEPALHMDGDKATVAGGDPKGDTQITPEELMELHSLDPEEWEIDRIVVNKWDANAGEGTKMPLYQLKLWLVRKKPIEFVFPARVPGDYIAPSRKPRTFVTKQPQLWVVAGDEQAPFQHPVLHDAVCNFLAIEQPYGFVGTGDLTDQNSVSRHKKNPLWHTALQDDLDHGYATLLDYRQAHDDMEMVWMPGNHDIRIDDFLLERAEQVLGIRRAELPTDEPTGLPVMSLPYLLRLDELGIEYLDPMGGRYEQMQFKIGPHVAVRHGSRTGKNAALDTIDRLTHSVIIGHTHGQSIQKRTVYDIERNHRVIQAVQTGALCDFNGGLGYAVDPNWVNGFVTVTLWPDGTHNIEMAEFNGEHLLWRGQRYA